MEGLTGKYCFPNIENGGNVENFLNTDGTDYTDMKKENHYRI
jgi:hypothetical protein